ncbi:MAG: 50S ribosomal protein L29 [Planctomycetota bacterium]|jgi:large subunit ribosomal protein L29
MKTEEIRAFSNEELASELDRLRRHLFDLRAQAVTEKLEDPSMVKKARRDIARILTERRHRAVASASQNEGKER